MSDVPRDDDMGVEEYVEELPELRYVRYELDGPVAVVTVDRQEALNALNEDVLVELSLAFGAAEANAEVRALVVTGAGRAFVAGARRLEERQHAGGTVGGPKRQQVVIRIGEGPSSPDGDETRVGVVAQDHRASGA